MQDDPGSVQRMCDRLQEARPDDPLAERGVLDALLRPGPALKAESRQEERRSKEPDAGVQMSSRPGRVVLTGQGVTEDFLCELADRLEAREA